MQLESEIISRYAGQFNGRLWWDQTPLTTADDRKQPFGILQIIHEGSREYVSNEEPEFLSARVQLNVWGESRLGVGAAMRSFSTFVRSSNTADWYARPLGGAESDFNETLKLRGMRQDFNFTYRNPNYAAP